MNILVTGANGYVGKFLCPALIKAGYKLTTVTRNPVFYEGANHFISDEYSFDDLYSAMQGQQVVVHLVAKAHQPADDNENTYESYRQVNVDKTVIAAKAAIKAGVKRFIYISSIKVNGEATESQPFTPMDVPSPQDAYGISKWEAEQALMRMCSENNMEFVIIRPPLIWGGEVKGNLRTIVKLINYRIPLPVGALQNRRDLVSLKNLSGLITCCIDHPLAKNCTFLVSDGVARTTGQIVQLLASQAKFRPIVLTFPLRFLLLCRNIPGLGRKLDKMLGNLEVDISDTCKALSWRPIEIE